MSEKRLYVGQSILAFFLVLFALASGHLFMVIINHVDQKISSGYYLNADKIEGRWYGDYSIEEEIKLNLKEAKYKGDIKDTEVYKEALLKLEKGENLKFYLLPSSNFLLIAMLTLFLIGFLVLVISKYMKNDALQSIAGLISGLFLWTGLEFSLLIAARTLGIAKKLTVFNGSLVGEYGEYILMKYSWGFLMIIIAYMLFLECSRCNFFLYFRRNLNLMRGAVATGKIDNYASHTAFMFSAVTWFFYVLLLLAYDERIFGVYSWFTYGVFFLSFSFTGYLFLKLMQIKGFGPRLRYAIPTTMVFWNDIEILAKWRVFQEPWLIFNPVTATIFFGGLFFGIYLVVKEVKKTYK